MVEETWEAPHIQETMAKLLAEVYRDSDALTPSPLTPARNEALSCQDGLSRVTPEWEGDPRFERLSEWFSLDSADRRRLQQWMFGLVAAKEAPRYESEYLPWKEAAHMAHNLADIAGFYQAFGLQPDPRRPERADHISLELDFVAHLFLRMQVLSQTDSADFLEQREIVASALKGFLGSHLAWWIPTFSASIESRFERIVALHGEGIDPHLNLLVELTDDLSKWLSDLCDQYQVEIDPGLPLCLERPVEGGAEAMDCGECMCS